MNKAYTIALILLTSLLSSSASATDLSTVFKQVSASVVTLTIAQKSMQLSGTEIIEQQFDGYGAGVIVDKSGLILTAAHVVNLADKIQVHLSDGQILDARTVSSFPFADLALVEIINPPADLPVAVLGDSDSLQIGEEVFVIGSPSGLSQTLTAGHFSGRPKDTGSFNIATTEFLQTDAPIIQGNSGGPMFNLNGEVMGIVSHFRTDTSGFGFIASINMAKNLILKLGDIWAGVTVEPIDAILSRAINAPVNGVLVQNVAAGSLAAALGLRPGLISSTVNGKSLLLGGDIILTIGGEAISFDKKGIDRAYEYMAGRKQGETIEMRVYRDGKTISLTAKKP